MICPPSQRHRDFALISVSVINRLNAAFNVIDGTLRDMRRYADAA
jgi:hypothetical protein